MKNMGKIIAVSLGVAFVVIVGVLVYKTYVDTTTDNTTEGDYVRTVPALSESGTQPDESIGSTDNTPENLIKELDQTGEVLDDSDLMEVVEAEKQL